MMNTRLWQVVDMIAAVVSILMLCSGPCATVAAQSSKVIASGLDNPRGITFGPEGALYVVEAGRGGNGSCTPFELFGDKMCFGRTGAVTRIWKGKQERIVYGLTSFAHHDGGFAFGPHDISFQSDGSAYVVMGGCFLELRGGGCGRLLRVKPNGVWHAFADLDIYERQHPTPLNNFGESNPFALLALPNLWIVANAAGNDLLRVSTNAKISKAAAFPKRNVDDPSSPGAQIRMDAVPSSVAASPDGAMYVSELTGYPFPVGGARIYRIAPGKKPQIYAEGFTNVIDIVFDHDGSLLVLEFAKNSLLSDDLTAALIRLKPNGSRQTLISKGLMMPTAIAIGSDNGLYISNCGACADNGQVIRIAVNWDD